MIEKSSWQVNRKHNFYVNNFNFSIFFYSIIERKRKKKIFHYISLILFYLWGGNGSILAFGQLMHLINTVNVLFCGNRLLIGLFLKRVLNIGVQMSNTENETKPHLKEWKCILEIINVRHFYITGPLTLSLPISYPFESLWIPLNLLESLPVTALQSSAMHPV